MDQVLAKINPLLVDIDKKIQQYPALQQQVSKLPVRPSLALVGVAGVLVLVVLFSVGGNALCNLVGFAYPIYASFKALKTKQSEDDAQWLTYWIVFAFFSLIESFTDFFLFWIPFYYLFKMLMLVWLYLPQTRGADVVFKKVIDPMLSKYEKQIDSGLNKGTESIQAARRKIDSATGGESEPGSKKAM